MTLTIELTPEQEAALRSEAQVRGTDKAGAVRLWLNGLRPVTPAERARRAEELFAQWAVEDEAMTAEELAQEERDWQTFQENVNANRSTNGERLIF